MELFLAECFLDVMNSNSSCPFDGIRNNFLHAVTAVNIVCSFRMSPLQMNGIKGTFRRADSAANTLGLTNFIVDFLTKVSQ